MPLRAQAATNITVKNYTEMPFFDDAHLAAQAKWGSNSSVTTFGNTQTCKSYWNYSGTNYDFQKAGNGILIQNVGTDLDGDAYDIKIVANSVKGTHSEYGTVYLQVQDYMNPLNIGINTRYKGEAKMTFSYLKHGTSKAANVKAAPTIYDIDARVYPAQDSAYSDLLCLGHEGVSFEGQTATCYVNYSSDMKIDKSAGTFYYNGDSANGGCGDKDLNGAVTAIFNSSSFTMTFSAYHATIGMSFDTYENPGSPSKSAVITG